MTTRWFSAIALFFLSIVMLQAQEIRINDDMGSSDQQFPSLAMHPNGPAVVCWQDERNGNPDIYMQMVNQRGAPFLKNLLVNDDPDTAHQYTPDVAMDAYGRFAVVWMDGRNGPSEIFCQRYHVNGAPIGSNFVIPDAEHDYFNAGPSISMTSSGEFIVVWYYHDTDVYARRFHADGSAAGDVITVHPPAEGAQIFPDVAIHEDGSFMIVWEDRRSGTPRIWARLFSADAAPITQAFNVSTNAVADERCHSATVAAGQNGEYVVVWDNLTQGIIMGSRFDSQGNRVGDVMTLSDRTTLHDARYSQVAAHPRWDFYQYAWSASETAGWHVYTDVYTPQRPITLNARQVDAAAQESFYCDLAMADLFNTVFVWQDKRSGDWDIYADWQGEKMTMRTTAGSGFDGIVPISWEPPYGYSQPTPYHIHRINPDGSMEVIATVNPSDRILPNLMLDYIDKDVVNGQTYQYGVQLDGEREDMMVFTSATPSHDGHVVNSFWASSAPTIDGLFNPIEWHDAAMIENVANPSADRPVNLFVKNDSSYLYIAVIDLNDDSVDAGNQLGILFDEDNDDEWEPAFSIGEGMLSLSAAAQTFIAYLGAYPNDLHFMPPQPASNVEFAVSDTSRYIVYECRIDLANSPLNAAPGDTLGAAIWIKDPGHFYGHGNGNAGEWPLDALWDSAQPLGDLILASEPGTYKLPLADRYVTQLRTIDLDGDGDIELLAATEEQGDETNSILAAFKWHNNQFYTIWASPTMEGFPRAMKIADIDADGLVDVLLSCENLKWIRHMEHDMAPPVALLDYALSDPFVVHDFNGDGLPDIIGGVTSNPDGHVWIFKQNADHTFSLVDSLDSVQGGFKVAGFDLNGDENMDLVTADVSSGRFTVFQNTDGFHFTPLFSDSVSNHILALETGDFDADGFDDFAISVSNENIRVFHNQRNGRFEEKYAGRPFGPCFALAAVNLDKDAYPDLVAAPFMGGLFLYHNTGGMDFDEIDAGLSGDRNLCIAAGDFDGNGAIDIAFGSDPLEVLFDASLRFGVSTKVVAQDEKTPTAFHLYQNYPNPFNPFTTIEFDVAHGSFVELKVFDMLGRELATLVNKKYAAGRYSTTFNASQFASGLYFYRIRMGDFQQTRKMMVVR